MVAVESQQRKPVTGPAGLLIALAATLSACATTPSARTPTKVEVQEAVGFTITEEARISGDVRVDYAAAIQLFEDGDVDRGIKMLEAIVAVAPDLSAPRIDLGIAHHRAGDLAAAESNLVRALVSNPGHPVAHNELGIIYRKTGRFAQARESYEAALATYPGYHFARRNLAVLCDLYLVDLDCALRNYEEYMTTVPADEEASMWIADIRSRVGQLEEK